MPTANYSPWKNLRFRIEQVAHRKLYNDTVGSARVYLELYVGVGNELKGWEEPDCKRLEPVQSWHWDQNGMPTDNDNRWDTLRFQIRDSVQLTLCNNHAGIARVYLELYMDASGELKGWEEPDCKRLEPSRVNWCDLLRGNGGGPP